MPRASRRRSAATATLADVIGAAAGQGIEAGDFDEILAAMRAGIAYANVHTTKWPGGEIRGQLERRRTTS